MATRADDVIDRRSMRRKLSFWRVAAIVLIAALVAVVGMRTFGGSAGTAAAPHIAKIKISGTITENDELLERLERVGSSPLVQGVIIYVNSPGGTTVGGEATFEAIRKLAGEKPVVAQVGTLAASAGYMIATAADHIVARQSSIVGSIGVLVQYPDVTELMDNLGIQVDGVKSSPLKAEPSPFTPTTEEERAMLRALVMDSYEWFVDLVDARRPISRDEVLALADGSIFTGRQAQESGLVDALGGEEVAVAWLGERGVDAELQVIEWEERSSGGWLSLASEGALGHLLGIENLFDDLAARVGLESIFLDGLVSVWHPQNSVNAN